MISIIAKLDEIFSYMFNMIWLYHFNYNWKVWLMSFSKTNLDKFFIQKNCKNVLKKKKKNWKNIFIWKIIRTMLEAFVSKSILHVYQNARWNQRKIAPKIIQNGPKKDIFLHKAPPPCE